MITLCIYHGNCPDGFTAAWVVNRAKPGTEFHHGVYDEPLPDVKGKDVMLVDFSYKTPQMKELIGLANSVLVLDHHATAEADIAPMIERGEVGGVFDMDRSGAMITWDYFFKGKDAPAILKIVQDSDLHRYEFEETKVIIEAVRSYEYSFAAWDRLMTASDEQIETLRVDGKAIKRKLVKDAKELVASSAYRITIGGHDVPVLNVPYTLGSEAANIMRVGEPFAAFYWDGDGVRTYGLRSEDNGVDVAEVAKKHGGGGHPHAAGFIIPRKKRHNP